MSMYIDNNGQLHDSGNGLTLNCPHCQVLTHLTPVSTPKWSVVSQHRPAQIGVVYRCDACNAPIFIKYPVKFYSDQRIELGNQFIELERTKEKFDFTYLPDQTRLLFKEALQCFSAGTYNAFASLCRRTVQSILRDAGETGLSKVISHLTEIRDLANLDKTHFNLVSRILLERDSDFDTLPTLDSRDAGILLEVMKDLLYQCYIRRGKLKQALIMRRYFADERSSTNNITAIKTAT